MGIQATIWVLSLPALVTSGYLGLLGVLARRNTTSNSSIDSASELPHFTFVVPAHNESVGIEATVQSLLGVDYPLNKRAVLVVADNCSDNTAEIAISAGARVLVRHDELRRGKGYALELAFQTLLDESATDAVVVVDADSDVSLNLLQSAAQKMANGADAMQAQYAVRNTDDSWRTRLMDVAFTLYHDVRSLARERMGVSAGLRGNGMVFPLDTLRKVPYRAYSLVEDVEYGIELGLQGLRVQYLSDAVVRAEMVVNGAASVSQRKRWEDGRSQLRRQMLPKLFRRAVVERNALLFDLAMDMIVPPLTTVAGFTLLGIVGTSAAAAGRVVGSVALTPWLLSAVGLSTYVVRGVMLSGRGLGVVTDLAHAPRYVLWKVMLPLRGRKANGKDWVRTARNGEIR